MSGGTPTATNNICRLDRMKREIIYVSWIAKSAPTYMSAGSLKAHPHICRLEHIKRGKIYVGRHAYSAHDISGPMHYMWLKDISRLRLARMLYAPLWHIWKYTYSMKY